ncbi:cysteine peptidase family C39 domain-containing protein [Vibrio cholerae]|uniref:cysteine peptidase family C39 domain-containing protein n=1 Tax=Vibrio cholerae TaxID=666 RepID=UPI003D333B4B
MKRVVQRKYDKGDCGIACIAMVTGQSYEHVEELFYQHELVNDGEYYTFHKDLIEVLDTLGFSAKRKLFTSWSKVEAPAIVKVNLRADNKWHWVVKAGDKNILDPNPSSSEVINHYKGRKGCGQYLLISPKP